MTENVDNCPTNVNEVLRWLSQEDGRINNTNKLNQLPGLRYFVFAVCSDRFYRNLLACINTECCEHDRNASDKDILVKKDLDWSSEPAAYTSKNDSIYDDIQTSVVNTVVVTKKPRPPSSKFAYTFSKCVVAKLDRETLKPSWIDEISKVFTEEGKRYIRI